MSLPLPPNGRPIVVWQNTAVTGYVLKALEVGINSEVWINTITLIPNSGFNPNMGFDLKLGPHLHINIAEGTVGETPSSGFLPQPLTLPFGYSLILSASEYISVSMFNQTGVAPSTTPVLYIYVQGQIYPSGTYERVYNRIIKGA